MTTPVADSTPLHVVRSGPEPGGAALPVVIVHGAMDRASSFGRLARLLADLPLVRYDRRGYGRSAQVGVGGLGDHVDDLLRILDGARAVVVGHSIGGVIALVAAQRRPDLVASVGAFEPPMSWAEWWPSTSAGGSALDVAADVNADADVESGAPDRAGDAAERFMRRMVGDARWQRLPAGTRADRRAEGPALLADLRSLRNVSAPYDATRLIPPVLAGYGTTTSERHRRAATELAESAPRGELWTVDGAGHGAHLSHPRELAAFVRRTVARADD